jgi:hypothetical protein
MNRAQFTPRQIWTLAIVLGTLILLLFLAPSSSTGQRQGSTYVRSPDGYGAWYAFMQARGTPVQRWEKPLDERWRSTEPARSTLLRVTNGMSGEYSNDPDEPSSLFGAHDWVKRGNVLVILGVRAPVSAAPFSSQIDSPVGAVQIETSRRHSPVSADKTWLGDPDGAIVWQQSIGKGKVIYAVTPFLAANAYQDAPGNFALLAKLVIEPGYPIWVDEYSHGYKDASVRQTEAQGNIFSYLAQTPVLLVSVQAAIVLLVLLWGQNQRFGPPVTIAAATVDNSTAYIQAMVAVLRKAECSEFVVETIGRAEQLEIQQALGLGTEPLPVETIVAAWEQQTGRPGSKLAAILALAHKPRRTSEPNLLRWLEQLKTIADALPYRHRNPG